MALEHKKRVVPIKYSSRDFNSIKEELVAYAKRYYSNTFKDFNDASFGSLMLDTVAYVGDVLSFYVDFQANESFLDSAIQFDSVIRLGRQLGYKFQGSQTAYGIIGAYIAVPADNTGLGPDKTYIPILKKGAKFSARDGGSYILNENIDFSDSSNEIVVLEQDSTTSLPTKYAIRGFGQIISGELATDEFEIGEYKRFPTVTLSTPNIIEVLSVFDSQGNQYFEVDSLSQNVVFIEVDNLGSHSDTASKLIKPIIVPRRFNVIHSLASTTLQFGFGEEKNLLNSVIPDPSEIALDVHGRNYISNVSFDPSKLTKTDALGVAPHNTTLTVVYRINTSNSANASVGSINNIIEKDFEFPNLISGITYSKPTLSGIVNSLEV